MKTLVAAFSLLAAAAFAAPGALAACTELLDHEVRPLGESEPVNLCEHYAGQVVLVVNTASRCGFTPQYEGLERLYRQYRDRGFVVLGFPSNDFGNQEPGTEQEIKSFCRLTYDVGFPMFEKTRAARADADPVYQRLGAASGVYPTWNFFKYVIGRDGRLAAVFPSKIEPESAEVVELIEGLL